MERVEGRAGELALRQVDDDYEIISNGVFLMDTRNGESERLLISAALDRLGRSGDILIGGLGVGFTLAQAVQDSRAERITVVELEKAIIEWHEGPLRRYSGGALRDPRVRLVEADLTAWLETTADRFDVICLDIDNGPDWTVTPANAGLYADAGLDRLAERLAPGGVLAVWSAMRSEEFEVRLRARFGGVDVLTVPVARGEPDVVYVTSCKFHKGPSINP